MPLRVLIALLVLPAIALAGSLFGETGAWPDPSSSLQPRRSRGEPGFAPVTGGSRIVWGDADGAGRKWSRPGYLTADGVRLSSRGGDPCMANSPRPLSARKLRVDALRPGGEPGHGRSLGSLTVGGISGTLHDVSITPH
ncbi:MAG: hypothetical protein ACLFOY_07715 [Desulfatibacillaceae bacterium]